MVVDLGNWGVARITAPTHMATCRMEMFGTGNPAIERENLRKLALAILGVLGDA